MAKKQEMVAVDEETGEMIQLAPTMMPRSWEEVEEALGGIVEYEGSFYEVVGKDSLVGTRFLITDIRVNPDGEFGPFVSICALLEDNKAVVFNDGSTGVAEQAREMLRNGRKAGIICNKGLRKSEYKYQQKDFDGNPQGPEIPATTYYIA